jgi:hypothetical protein
MLALPTIFPLLDTQRDPRVWDPSGDWSFAARLALVSCKAIPTLALLVLGFREVIREGAVGRGIWRWPLGWRLAPQRQPEHSGNKAASTQ